MAGYPLKVEIQPFLLRPDELPKAYLLGVVLDEPPLLLDCPLLD